MDCNFGRRRHVLNDQFTALIKWLTEAGAALSLLVSAGSLDKQIPSASTASKVGS